MKSKSKTWLAFTTAVSFSAILQSNAQTQVTELKPADLAPLAADADAPNLQTTILNDEGEIKTDSASTVGEANDEIDQLVENVVNSEDSALALKIKDYTPMAVASDIAKLPPRIESRLNYEVKGVEPEELSAIREFYMTRYYQPLFVVDEGANDALDKAISLSYEEGLPIARYHFDNPHGDPALAEIQAAAQFLRYSHDMERGLVAPKSLGAEYDFTPEGRGNFELLLHYSRAENKDAFMQDLQPKDMAYPIMKKELARLQSLMGADIEDPVVVSKGGALKLGDAGPRVGELRARLVQLGFASEGSPTPEVFDETLDVAVKAFQTSAGLGADGIVGPASLSILNPTPSKNLRKVLIAMERLRWGPQEVDGRQIHVNLANFTAQVRDDNQKTFETIVVVGKNEPDYRTPEFHDVMTHMVVNPTWNVPSSISTREYLPRLKRDPGMLARNNMVLKSKSTGKQVSPFQVDFSQYNENNFPYRLQQLSGDGNALGNVKFMFPNSHNIYLHDTQAKSLFSRSVRTFSHGCVRVRDPEDLATTLLEPQYKDPRGTYRSVLQKGKERYLNLATPVPIFLTYFTAYVNDAGTVSYTSDAYGRDAPLARALAEEGLNI